MKVQTRENHAPANVKLRPPITHHAEPGSTNLVLLINEDFVMRIAMVKMLIKQANTTWQMLIIMKFGMRTFMTLELLDLDSVTHIILQQRQLWIFKADCLCSLETEKFLET